MHSHFLQQQQKSSSGSIASVVSNWYSWQQSNKQVPAVKMCRLPRQWCSSSHSSFTCSLQNAWAWILQTFPKSWDTVKNEDVLGRQGGNGYVSLSPLDLPIKSPAYLSLSWWSTALDLVPPPMVSYTHLTAGWVLSCSTCHCITMQHKREKLKEQHPKSPLTSLWPICPHCQPHCHPSLTHSLMLMSYWDIKMPFLHKLPIFSPSVFPGVWNIPWKPKLYQATV